MTTYDKCPTCGQEVMVLHGDEGTSHFVGLGHKRSCVLRHADFKRVVEWIRNAKRKSAVTAFTEGPERQIAYAVEDVLREKP